MCLAILAACFSSMSRAAEPAPAVGVGGDRFDGTLEAVDEAWNITFSVDGQNQSLAANQLVAWGRPAEPLRGARVLLADGSLLVAEPVSSDETNMTVESPLVGQLVIPLELVAGVVLHPPTDPLRGDLLADRLRGLPSGGDGRGPGGDRASQSDRLILENGDELSGTIQGLTPSAVQFDSGVGPAEIENERVAAVAFNPALLAKIAPSGLRALVGLQDGSLLVAGMAIVDEGQARLTVAGSLPISVPRETVTFVQVLGGEATYVSDLEVDSYRHVPYLMLPWEYHTDANVLGGRLRSAGRVYYKGIGMHSASRLTWKLDKPYRKFEAEMAIDDHTEGKGSVVFRVFAGSQERFRSGVIRGGDAPLPISIDITGATRLSLVVDFADRGDELDHANWLNPRLVE